MLDNGRENLTKLRLKVCKLIIYPNWPNSKKTHNQKNTWETMIYTTQKANTSNIIPSRPIIHQNYQYLVVSSSIR